MFTSARRPHHGHGTVNVFALREGGRDVLLRGLALLFECILTNYAFGFNRTCSVTLPPLQRKDVREPSLHEFDLLASTRNSVPDSSLGHVLMKSY